MEYAKNGELSSQAIEKIQKLTVGILDLTVMDQMSKSQDMGTYAGTYTRESQRPHYRYTGSVGKQNRDLWMSEPLSTFQDHLFLNKLESLSFQKRLNDLLKSTPNIKTQKFDNVEDLLNAVKSLNLETINKSYFYIEGSITNQQAQFLEKELGNIKIPQKVMISFCINLDENVSLIQVYNPYGLNIDDFTRNEVILKKGDNGENKPKFYRKIKDIAVRNPPSEQNIAFSLLSNGQPYKANSVKFSDLVKRESRVFSLDEDSIIDFVILLRKETQKISVQREAKRKRLLVSLRNTQDVNTETFLANHIKHYENFFRFDDKVPIVKLTNSGTTANDSTIKVIADELEKDDKVFMDNGWYYENKPEVKNSFNISQNLKDVRAMFLGLVDVNGIRSESEQKTFLDSCIQQMIKNAKSSDKPYFIVMDKTFNPLYQVLKDYPNIPSNLNIIETVSFSKHQRGERNYFFGSIVYFGEMDISEKLNDKIAGSQSNLSPKNIENFPRITHQEIQRNMEHISKLETAFAEQFKEVQKDLPPHLHWGIIKNEQLLYLIPPIDGLIVEAIKSLDISSREINLLKRYQSLRNGGENDMQKLTLEEAKSIIEILQSSLKKIFGYISIKDTENIVTGDSFGLTETRVAQIPNIKFEIDGHCISIDPMSNLTSRIRISPGRNDSIEGIQKAAKDVAGWIFFKLEEPKAKKIIDANNNQAQPKQLGWDVLRFVFEPTGLTEAHFNILIKNGIGVNYTMVPYLDTSKKKCIGTDIDNRKSFILEEINLDGIRIKNIEVIENPVHAIKIIENNYSVFFEI